MSIHVAIQPGLTPDEVSVQVSGQQRQILTADILKSVWGVDDIGKVAQAVAAKWGYGTPRLDRIHFDASEVKNAARLTPDGPVALIEPNPLTCFAVLMPTGGRLIEIQQEVVLADRAIWDNRTNPDDRHFAATMSVESSSSVESSWTHSQTIGITAEIGTSIGPVDAKTSLSYEDTWGQSHGESKSQTISFSNEIKGELKGIDEETGAPGELQVAALTQQRGFAIVETDFSVSTTKDNAYYQTGCSIGFSGQITIEGVTDGHPRWSRDTWVIPVVELLAAAGAPAVADNDRRDKIGVFADADLASYPIPDKTPASIEKAAGVHELRTTYQYQKAVT